MPHFIRWTCFWMGEPCHFRCIFSFFTSYKTCHMCGPSSQKRTKKNDVRNMLNIIFIDELKAGKTRKNVRATNPQRRRIPYIVCIPLVLSNVNYDNIMCDRVERTCGPRSLVLQVPNNILFRSKFKFNNFDMTN